MKPRQLIALLLAYQPVTSKDTTVNELVWLVGEGLVRRDPEQGFVPTKRGARLVKAVLLLLGGGYHEEV